ncbi:MAG TPA: glycosyltransferase [Gaiellaceae bacterium]|nr:glycosyltransferase [Gaiellaceae bacterium]
MKLSVVIPCRDDPQVVACARSVDAPAEIVIALNGSTPDFVGLLERELGDRVRLERLPRPNRSLAAEHGIAAAAHDHVLLMDSDCVFTPGSIAAIDRALAAGDPDAEVFKGDIAFDRGTTRLSALVARSRHRRIAGRLSAYKPPLAFSRRLRARLGGRFFDPRLPWKEDADLDYRVRRAGIRVVPVRECLIRHAALSPLADLRSSFLYGVGHAIARHLAVPMQPPERSVLRSLAGDGAEAALYLVVANGVRAAGVAYGTARIRWSGGTWLDELAAS